MTKCDYCGNNSIVVIEGITRNINLCQTHIVPPYEIELVKGIIDEIKVDTVVSFLKTIYDRIEQEKKIREVEAKINEVIKVTKANSVNQLTEEKNKAIVHIKKLESELATLKDELAVRKEELKKVTALKQTIESSNKILMNELSSKMDEIIDEIREESQNIVSQIKASIPLPIQPESQNKTITSRKRRSEPKSEESIAETEEDIEKEDSKTDNDDETTED